MICEACETTRKRARRKRCPSCKRLVGPCCWHEITEQCLVCYGIPADKNEHLARIQERYEALDSAISEYERACLDLWDGDSAAVERLNPTPKQAFDLWRVSILEAAELLKVPVRSLKIPDELPQEFPITPTPGDDYNIEALEKCLGGIKVHAGGKDA